MRVRASAGAASFRRRPTLEEALAEAEEQVEALRTELEEDPAASNRRRQKARERAARERAERIKGALELRSWRPSGSRKDREKARCSTTDADSHGDEDARRRLSPGLQRAVGHGHRLASHHRRGRYHAAAISGKCRR